MAEEKTYLSVVVPFYDEADSLPAFVKRFDEVFASFDRRFELIFVDDGSTDSGPEFVKKLVEERKNVRLVRLDGRFGRDAALCAGLRHAAGDYKAVISADLQYDPADLLKLLEKLAASPRSDMAAGYVTDPSRYEAEKSVLLPRYAAAVGGRLKDPLCSLRIYSRSLVDRAQSYFGNTYSPTTLLPRMSKSFVELEVSRSPRAAGANKRPLEGHGSGTGEMDDRLLAFRYLSGVALAAGLLIAFTAVVLGLYLYGSFGNISPNLADFGRRLSLGFLLVGFFGGLGLAALAVSVRRALPLLTPIPEPVRYRTAEIIGPSRPRRKRRPRRRSRKPTGAGGGEGGGRGEKDKAPEEPPAEYTGPVTLESIVREEKRSSDERGGHTRGRRNGPSRRNNGGN